MKTIFIFIFSAAILLTCQRGYAQSGQDRSGITLQLVSNKTEYLEGEKIWLTATVVNNGYKIDSIPLFSVYDITSMILLNSNGIVSIQFETIVDYFFYLPHTILKPDEKENINIDVLFSHGTYSGIEELIWGNSFLQPDSYVAYIEHALRYGDTMKIRSNEIRFNIVEPDLEERKILNEIREINSMSSKTPDEKTEKATAYYKLLNKENVSRSKYYEQLFYNYISIIKIGKVQTDSKIFIADCKKFLNAFPNSYNARSVLYSIASVLKNQGEKEEIVPVFVELKINNYDTRLSDAVDSILNNNEFREYYLK